MDVVAAAGGSTDEFAWYESVSAGGSGGSCGSCLIERAGLPDGPTGRLRVRRDALLDTQVGRGLAELCYRL